jgi:diguanylate cyclase (GGDEF)-like protein
LIQVTVLPDEPRRLSGRCIDCSYPFDRIPAERRRCHPPAVTCSGEEILDDRQSISIAVLTANQDDVELVNRTLRDAGQVAHCHWVATPNTLDETLESRMVELIIVNKDSYADTIRQLIEQKDAYMPEVPVVAISKNVDEATIQEAMKQGACDLVSIDKKARLQAVVSRELRAYRVERALNTTINSASAYRRQLNDYMQDSAVAIAYVQEGIVTDVNLAWLKLFRIRDKDDVAGLPLMDNFDSESQAAIKGALVATLKGKWDSDGKLVARGRIDQQESLALQLAFQLTDYDGSPHVQIKISPPEVVVEEPTKLVHEALQRDPTTLFFHRAEFLERLTRRIAKKPNSGLHVLAYIKPDHFSELHKIIGILPTEEVLSQLAEEVRKRMQPRDVAGRFEGTVLMVLLERGSDRDAETWAQQLVEHVHDFDFRIGDRSLNLTCTVGICAASGVYSSLEELIVAATEAHQQGKKNGGNCVILSESADADTRLRKYDAIWVRLIKGALMENRFRLAQLPIAGLRSDTDGMYDLLVRMIDEQGNALLPSDFLPAAERNNLMKTIDRWIVSAAMDFCVENKATRVFVRLSQQSLHDTSLFAWMQKECVKRKVEPLRICIQIPEQEAAKHIKFTRQVVEQIRAIGVGFALQHYGVDKNRFQILDILRPDYVKIDGELMHTLTTDTRMQESIRLVTEAAEQRNIETIAERVENANAMAVLFQLGVNYMQGHYVHEPEVVLQEPPSVSQTTLDAIG